MKNTIKTPMLPEPTRKLVQTILEAHGVKIEVHSEPEEEGRYPYCLFRLPEGAKKERAGFIGAYHEHNRISLPDGFIFFQEVDAEDWSSISFSTEEEGMSHG